MWQSHRPGSRVLPRPSITCAPAGTVADSRGADRGDRALVDDDRLIGEEANGIGVEEPDARERDRRLRGWSRALCQARRLLGHRRRLRGFDLRLFAGICLRQPRDPEGDREELVVGVRPDRAAAKC